MAAPDFVLELRRHIGHAELWLPGVTAVVRRGNEILLVRRADTDAWAPVTGIIDPGEEPAVAARREVLEETGVTVADDESSDVRWFPVDDLPALAPNLVARITCALSNEPRARFSD